MVRSYWIGPLFGAMALTGLAWGQTLPSVPAPAVESQERFVNVQEPGKPAQRCKILKMWIAANGSHAYQVQAVDTGELMTIEDADATPVQSGGPIRAAAMRIFHTGGSNPAPLETPEPPSGAVVVGHPSDIHPKTAESSGSAAKSPPPPASMATPAKWPSAFSRTTTDNELTAPKKVELTPLAPAPVTANPAQVQPIASVPAQAIEMQPTRAPVAVVQNTAPYKATTPPPASILGSPYNAQPTDGSAAKPSATVNAGSPYAPNAVNGVPEGKQEPSVVHWNTDAPKMQPWPRIVVQEAKPVATTVLAKTGDCQCDDSAPKVAIPAQPGDWRESWGKTDGPKSPTPAVAVLPKTELPHAEARTDDPLKSPEKYSKLPPGVGAFVATPERKTPLLALLAHDQPPAAKAEVKQPLTAALPPVPGPTPDALAQVAKPAPVVVEMKPPVKPTTTIAETKPAAPAKPAAPLGMGSVLAAASPELAPPAPLAKPKSGSQAQAMGVNANEPNAFTDHPQGGPVAVAANAFGAPQNPAPVNPQADALASNAFPVAPQVQAYPAYGAQAMRMPAPAAMTGPHAPTGYVLAAGYSQQSYDLSQLTAVLHGSLYPSQREWAVESLASLDWRKQPQILDLLMERAKQDPAPTVRAECVRSLGRMKADTVAVVEVVKALQSDEDSRVRQEAVEASANLAGAPSH